MPIKMAAHVRYITIWLKVRLFLLLIPIHY